MTNAHDQPGSAPARPQYGEYAPPGWSWTPPVDAAPAPEEESPRPERVSDSRPARPAHPRDRMATTALLALGVFFAVPTLLDPNSFLETLQDLYRDQGVGTYTSIALARSLGVLIGVSQTAIVVVAILLSVRRLRAGRRAVLVPILGIVTTIVVSLAITLVAKLADPAFPAYVSGMSGAAGLDS